MEHSVTTPSVTDGNPSVTIPIAAVKALVGAVEAVMAELNVIGGVGLVGLGNAPLGG